MMTMLRKRRFDYFLIWSHGIAQQKEILQYIRGEQAFRILEIRRHVPRNLERFVREVYSFDYAPFEHLKSKTRYLLDLPPEVVFIFIENLDVQDVVCGEETFRHVECVRVKSVKEAIRDALNPRIDGHRSEHHVVHASDSELQTHKMLQYLGFEGGIDGLRAGGHVLLHQAPHHLARFGCFSLRRIPMSKLACSLLRVDPASGSAAEHEVRGIDASPHYQCLQENLDSYADYYSQSPGIYQTDDHSAQNLKQLAVDFSYLKEPYETAYIVVRYEARSDRFIVMDGIHRAAILANQQATGVVVAVVDGT
jgi:hypothetical protein